MSGMAYNWHKDGTLLELEEKWGVKPSPWLAQMHDQLQYDTSYLENSGTAGRSSTVRAELTDGAGPCRTDHNAGHLDIA